MTRSKLSAVAMLAVCFITVSALADDFHPISNAIKYKDSGVPVAKGRSGSAAIEARALLNKNGTTDIEVTTGSFDAGTTSGNLEKVQVKIGDADAVNYAAGGAGAFTIPQVPGLLRFQPVQVTAHVSGVDGARTDVVTVNTQVRLRPDLTFIWITVQQHGMVGLPVSVSAIVAEQNRDTGAYTDCVLKSGGIEIDRARNIWVDAGGTVTCSMAAAFQTPGMQFLSVSLDNTRPADYDPMYETVYGSSQIHAYDEEMNEWTATIMDEEFTYEMSYTSPWGGYEGRNSGWVSSFGITAYQREVLDMPSLRFSYHAESDGQVLADLVDVPFHWRDDDDRMACGRVTVGAITAQACRMSFGPGSGQPATSQYSVAGNGGDVTYYSNEWSRWYNPETDTYEYYTYNSTWRNVYGYQQPLGNTVTQDFSVTDGTRTLWARPSVTLTPYEYSYGWNTCYGDYCDNYSAHRVGKWGYVRGGLGF
jgi:hypothetical protein